MKCEAITLKGRRCRFGAYDKRDGRDVCGIHQFSKNIKYIPAKGDNMLDVDSLAELIEGYMKTIPMGPSGDDDRPWDSVSMANFLLPEVRQKLLQEVEEWLYPQFGQAMNQMREIYESFCVGFEIPMR